MSDTDNRQPKHRGLIHYKPGQSGNPKGRPKGAKSKLTESFWADMADVWERGGKAALEAVMTSEPGTFVKLAGSLMPKETELTLRTMTANQLSDDELADIAIGSGEDADSAPLDPQQLN